MKTIFNNLSIADLDKAIELMNKANDHDSLFDVDYENDGGSAPRRIRGRRKKYVYEPELIEHVREELNGRLHFMRMQYRAVIKKARNDNHQRHQGIRGRPHG